MGMGIAKQAVCLEPQRGFRCDCRRCRLWDGIGGTRWVVASRGGASIRRTSGFEVHRADPGGGEQSERSVGDPFSGADRRRCSGIYVAGLGGIVVGGGRA